MAQPMAQRHREAEIKFTYRDWLQLPEDGQRYEIIEGELFVTPAPATKHQRISAGIEWFLYAFAVRHNLIVLDAPIGVKLSSYSTVQPDIVVISKERQSIIEEQVVAGAPDLIIEITSPRTAKVDRTRKKELYARYGVKEYWIVDAKGETVDVFTLVGREYELYRTFGREDILRSRLFGKLRIPLDRVFP